MWYNANVKRQWTVDSIERGPSGPDDRTCHGPDRPRTGPGEEGPPSERNPKGEREGRTLGPQLHHALRGTPLHLAETSGAYSVSR